jgi:excisionase family DNA binding protein
MTSTTIYGNRPRTATIGSVTDEPLLTVEDVARHLKLHPETVRRWVRAGKLRAISLGSDRAGLRIRASEVQRLLASGSRGAVT